MEDACQSSVVCEMMGESDSAYMSDTAYMHPPPLTCLSHHTCIRLSQRCIHACIHAYMHASMDIESDTAYMHTCMRAWNPISLSISHVNAVQCVLIDYVVLIDNTYRLCL
jgi:hypothetical protein